MNKDKIQIGDLVTKGAYMDGSARPPRQWKYYGVGLAVDILRPDLEESALQVYWFRLGEARIEWSASLAKKLSPTQKETE